MALYTKKQSEHYDKIGTGFLISGFVCLLLSLLMGTFAIIGFVLIGIAIAIFSTGSKWQRGAEGEEQTIRSLEKFDENFQIIHDVKLPEQYGNIDHIVIGETGIFIIETKNWSGYIVCEGDEWKRHYVWSGLDYPCGSPSRQVKRNAVLLKNFLNEKLPQTNIAWINSIVVFTNPSVYLKLRNPSVPVLRPAELYRFIRSHGSRLKLPEEVSRRVASVLGIYTTVPTVRWTGELKT